MSYKKPDKSHPRYLSLVQRDKLAKGVKMGITSLQGLTAHGRGEAFNYLIGEKTQKFSRQAIKAAAALLTKAKNPVLSINGNTAILAPSEFVTLSKLIPAKLEINLFHQSKKRQVRIRKLLERYGAEEIFLPDGAKIRGIKSNRKNVSSKGQIRADVIFVPLEDGDRTENLRKAGKKVITVDLNPLSRTSKSANITICDEFSRTMPLIVKEIKKMKAFSSKKLAKIIKDYDNQKILSESLKYISKRLHKLA